MSANLISDYEIIQGLEAKKQVMKSQIDELKSKILELNCGLSNIDTTILFLTGGSVVNKPERNMIFKPNECKILVLDYLREMNTVVTSRQVAEYLADKVNFDITVKKRLDFRISSLNH